ncbi:MAG: ATP-binding cassette domain-containing protein [Rhizobiales bacterium]|nr:ATP-binding cassette domain-containing protein [Hyphomicrobiales bacterium]
MVAVAAQRGAGLRLVGVSKRFARTLAVANVDLGIEAGEFLTLLGPSGSGKTTLLMMIAGFEDVTAGDILVDGTSIATVPAEKRHFGMVFQGYALFPHMNVRQNVGYALSVRGTPRPDVERRVDEMLELVQLRDFGARLPRQLSGGQQQRVALARALCFSPKVLLLDEPLGALDKKLRVEVQAQLKDIHTSVGTTFIYVTHDQEEALSMSDRVVIMNHGEIVQTGTPEELYERPASVFAANFLGRSNFLRSGGQVFALRPEKIDIAPAGMGEGALRQRGTIRSITYLGSSLMFVVDTEGAGNLEVVSDAWRTPHRFAAGQSVNLSWKETAAVRVADT